MATKNVFPTTEEDLKSFYLLVSPEKYLLDEQISYLQDNFASSKEDINWVYLEDDEENFCQEFSRAVLSVSMLAGRKFILVKCSKLFQKKVAFSEKIIKVLAENPPQVTVVFLVEGKIDGRIKSVREFKKYGEIEKLKAPQYQDLKDWIKDKFAEEGKKVEAKLVYYLEYIFDNNLEALAKEIDKLITCNMEEELIKFADSQDLLAQGGFITDQMIFKLMDNWAKNNISKALRIYRRLIKNGEEPFKILSMLQRQLRLLLVVKELKKENLTAKKIAKKISEHPYPVKKCLQQTAAFTFEQLERALENLLQLNRDIITGKVRSPEIAIEDYLLQNL